MRTFHFENQPSLRQLVKTLIFARISSAKPFDVSCEYYQLQHHCSGSMSKLRLSDGRGVDWGVAKGEALFSMSPACFCLPTGVSSKG